MCALNVPVILHLDPQWGRGPVCPTSRLSDFIAAVIKLLTRCVPSYIKDDMDFFFTKLDGLKANIEPGTLVTFSVESLYANISSELAHEALLYWLN